jgi:hypothetical protein
VDIGYFIISVYQGICDDEGVPATSSFPAAIKQESWCSIAKSLLEGALGVAPEKLDNAALMAIGKELRKVLASNKRHLQAFLLSLLQMKGQPADQVSAGLVLKSPCAMWNSAPG